MSEGKNWILSFRRKLVFLHLINAIIIGIAIGILLMPLSFIIAINPYLIFGIAFIIAFLILFFVKRIGKISSKTISSYLNARFPELEESANLLLKPEGTLSRLERFQVEKINQVFPLTNSLKEPLIKFYISLVILLFAVALSFGVNRYMHRQHGITMISVNQNHLSPLAKEKIPAEIRTITLKISPPSYTGIAPNYQQRFNLKVPKDAQVFWDIKMNVTVKKLRILFNDKEIGFFKNTEDLTWKFNKVITQSGFYQLEFDGKKTDLYQIEVVPDLPVSIKIIQPKPHTTIDVGQVPVINLAVLLKDDYGISDAYIAATMASGKGEGVSFTEKKLTFNTLFNNRKVLSLSKTIDLRTLGMKPGDELYFYINAKDNHGQLSRSDVYLVSIVDTSELMSMAGMTNGVDLVPEYFRSQRQIIIDTEKLLVDQVKVSDQEFKDKSNALGVDQKLLRLRYGKFLGEESETEIGGHDHVDGDDHESYDEKFGDVQALMDQYAHKHDIAEDATFFEPEMKMQLKAVLNEMWSSELRLRTYKPQEALPYAYKALRLLKDLQQKSRAYVAKTTIKTVRLKMEKRLSGELNKIVPSTQNATHKDKDKTTEELKVLLSVLEERKLGKSFNYGERELLRAGEKQLISAAANEPSSYLLALKSLRRLSIANKIVSADINTVQKAIQNLLGVEQQVPQITSINGTESLYRNYYKHLKNAGQ